MCNDDDTILHSSNSTDKSAEFDSLTGTYVNVRRCMEMTERIGQEFTVFKKGEYFIRELTVMCRVG